jgi:hypothetical protein
MKMSKGPEEVLRALASGDPEQLREALEFQRESFRARFGVYPEEGIVTRCNGLCDDDENHVLRPHPDCPIHGLEGS